MTDTSARESLIEVMRGLGFDFDTPEAQAAFDMLDVAGFAVVPKEPTPEMLTAMHDAWDYFDANSDVFRREYKAALDAANPKEEGK